MEEPVTQIIDAVRDTLDKCPPELSGDIMDRGIGSPVAGPCCGP